MTVTTIHRVGFVTPAELRVREEVQDLEELYAVELGTAGFEKNDVRRYLLDESTSREHFTFAATYALMVDLVLHQHSSLPWRRIAY